MRQLDSRLSSALIEGKRRWFAHMAFLCLASAVVTAWLLFRGYTDAGRLAAPDYLICVLMNGAAPFVVGFLPKNLFDEASSGEVSLTLLIALVTPAAGLTSWMLTTGLFLGFLGGWPLPNWIFGNGFVLGLATLLLGIVLSILIPIAWMLRIARKAG